jgi:N-succinyldiaminopimelate aminotransferase
MLDTQISRRAARLEHIVAIGVDAAARRADDSTGDLLRLENMDTDVPPPAAALEVSRREINSDAANSYLPFFGTEDLRAAVVERIGKLSGVSYDADRECIITAGGCNGVLNTLLALINPGDEVIMTDPIYVGLINRVRLAGGVPVFVPYHPQNSDWRLDLVALRRAVSDKTRALLLANPSMPSGAVLNREEWNAIADVCASSNAWLIYDAALERILYDGTPCLHPASLDGLAGRTITVGCASKEQRMIGWRVGWVVGPAAAIRDISLVSISNVVCQVGIAQAAAAAALRESDADFNAVVREWQARRDCVLNELKSLPVLPCGGGWSLLLDVAALGWRSEAASDALMTKGGIAATPMKNWGSERSDRYVRFVFANEPVARLRGLGQRVKRALIQHQ